jgi:hypothetical protein
VWAFLSPPIAVGAKLKNPAERVVDFELEVTD